MTSINEPPNFEAHTKDLVSVEDSKITSVSLYSGRAEITRLFKVHVNVGLNQLSIKGLPNVLDADSLRVEGRGSATIHDVTLGDIPTPPVESRSEELDALNAEHEIVTKARERTVRAIAGLGTYLDSLDIQHLNPGKLTAVLESYDSSGKRLDEALIGQDKKLKDLSEHIKEETKRLKKPSGDVRLRKQVTVGVFADSEADVEVAVIYAVSQANWSAGYDIRVNTDTKESLKPVKLIYKASIVQNTGESWDDVPLTLETATPTFGVSIPTLSPWDLHFYSPPSRPPTMHVMSAAMPGKPGGRPKTRVRTMSRSYEISEPDSEEVVGYAMEAGEPDMDYAGLDVTSKGGASATFKVPGLVTIPSDYAVHNFTIVQLDLEAEMSWISVPKVDARVHLKASVKNASDYTLLQGSASIYVDGSFISRSGIPSVSPQESFQCPLGLDPSIRITYHPRSKKASQSGFYSKSANNVFVQRITVQNTRTIPITNLRIVDQIPVSQDAKINVKLVSPSLSLDASSNKASREATVSEGVQAQWGTGDPEEEQDADSKGRDGKLNWTCQIPEQSSVNIKLQWEVSTPANMKNSVVGL